MLKALCLGLLFSGSTLAAHAETAPVLAEYWTNNGSLPPEYAWETSVTIHADGTLQLKHCRGYETEGPACKTRRAKVAAEEMQAIRDATLASGLLEKPARNTEFPMVGGDVTGGLVYLDGAEVKLLSEPAEADVKRVGEVLQVIRAAIPSRFDRLMDGE